MKDGVPGAHLVQPFHRSGEGASTILVNRGFITSTRANAIRGGRERPPLADGEGNGDIVIEGMLTKLFETGRKRWAPDNEPEKNEWFWKDVEGMAKWCGEESGVQPVLVDAIECEHLVSHFTHTQRSRRRSTVDFVDAERHPGGSKPNCRDTKSTFNLCRNLVRFPGASELSIETHAS